MMLKALEKSSTEKELQREQKNGMNDEVAVQLVKLM